jgi:hypothetical protein
MRSMRPALLIVVGLGLTACVGVNDGSYGQPYGAFSGSSYLGSRYVYREPSNRYLYDQSQRSWQRNYAQPSRNSWQGRSYYPGRNNPPGHNNPPGRGNAWGHGNRQDRD